MFLAQSLRRGDNGLKSLEPEAEKSKEPEEVKKGLETLREEPQKGSGTTDSKQATNLVEELLNEEAS